LVIELAKIRMSGSESKRAPEFGYVYDLGRMDNFTGLPFVLLWTYQQAAPRPYNKWTR
jgi:hypothetical protein